MYNLRIVELNLLVLFYFHSGPTGHMPVAPMRGFTLRHLFLIQIYIYIFIRHLNKIKRLNVTRGNSIIYNKYNNYVYLYRQWQLSLTSVVKFFLKHRR